MVLFLGMFLVNTLCAIVPCQKLYDPPVPVPKRLAMESKAKEILEHQPFQNMIKIPILQDKNAEFLVVKTESGYVQGFKMKTIRARDIYAFTGIPYAEPPKNELRYRAPQKKKPWTGIFQATQTPSDCMQIDGMQLLRIIGSEGEINITGTVEKFQNCLYANIYTPILPKNGKNPELPVLLFFHGGSFAFSGGSSFGPAYLLDRDVILVTFNYRLGSFGFLSTGDHASPGNFGLKDQNLLMRWVYNNIHEFGGEKNKITLFGQSAGAVSVHLHILSKQSRGLFSNAISQSGNAFCFWGVRDNSIDFSFRLANALKCPINDSIAMVGCLRKLDPLLIIYTEANLPSYKVFPGVFFGPVLERPSDDAFLEERPEFLYENNMVPPIPWINGFLADEGNGVGFLAWLYPMVMQEMDERWVELGPSILDIHGDIKHVSRTVSYVRQYYFGDKAINFYSRHELSQMMGDRLIMGAIYKGLKYHAKVAPTYGYYFNYTGKYGTAAAYGLNNADWGISHDDDLIYLLNSTTYHALSVGEPEYEMSEFLTKVWSNFATHGEPTYILEDGTKAHFWEPVKDPSKDDIPIVLITRDLPKMISFPFLNRVKFWSDMDLISQSKVGPDTIMPKKQLPNNNPTELSPKNLLLSIEPIQNYYLNK